MASEYYGYSRGVELSPDLCTRGTSTTGADVELRVDLTKSLTKLDVREMTQAILRLIEDGRSTEIGNI